MSSEDFPKRMAFVGAGNMAEAIVRGMLDRSVCTPEQVVVSDVDAGRLEHFETTYGVSGYPRNEEAARDAEAVVLAIKPQMAESVVPPLSSVLPADGLLISIMAGVPSDRLATLVGQSDIRIVRVMPNTPALVGQGVCAVCAGTGASQDDVDRVGRWLRGIGAVVATQEPLMNAVTATSGSGPAYAFYLMEHMIRGAVEAGLPPAGARDLVLQTVQGAAQLAIQSGEDPATLRERVTSPGGTTEAALKILDEGNVGPRIVQAMGAARERAAELAKG